MYLFDSLYNCEDSCDNIQIGEKGKVIEESSVHLEEKLQLSLIINYKKTQISKLLITINVQIDISHQESVHEKISAPNMENVNVNT